jgi:hypothetical protein
MALSGFTLDDVTEVTIEEDTDPKTVFVVRPVPQGKRDELRAKSYDYLAKKERAGADVVAARAHKREAVRWGIKEHRGGSDGLKVCKTEEVTFAGKKFTVLSDETIDVYERTIVAVHKVKVPPEKPGDKEDEVEVSETLLDRLFAKVEAHQTLSLAERRGLSGDGLASAD